MWRVAAFFVCMLCFLLLCSCNFFRTSRRGIILTHWSVINYLSSQSWGDFQSSSWALPFHLLLPLATLFIAVDYLTSIHSPPKRECCYFEIFLQSVLLIVMDATCIFLMTELQETVALTVLLVMIFVFVVVACCTKEDLITKIQEMLPYDIECMFSNYQNPMECFGATGHILYAGVASQLVFRILPMLKCNTAFTYLAYMCLTIGTLNWLRTPMFVGGLINAVKSIAASRETYYSKQKFTGMKCDI